MVSLRGYVALTRPNVCLLAVFGVLVGYLLSPGSGYLATYGVELILAAAAAFLACGAGNVINDYFDYKIDKTNAPKRPIPNGLVKRSHALIFYVALSVTSLAIALNVSEYFFYIAIVNIAVLSAYGWRLKRSLYMKNSAVSWLSSSSFLAGGIISNVSIAPAVLVIFVVSFLGTFSREIFKDIQDLKGDKKQGVRTFATFLGKTKASYMASLFAMAALLSIVSPYLLGMYTISYLLAMSPGVVFGILAIAYRKDGGKSQKLLKVSMYCVTVTLILMASMRIF